MGNITKRGSRGLVADGARALEEGAAVSFHTRLYEAILREDCTALWAQLRSHPVNEPMTVLASSTGYRLLLSQVPSSSSRSLLGKRRDASEGTPPDS